MTWHEDPCVEGIVYNEQVDTIWGKALSSFLSK